MSAGLGFDASVFGNGHSNGHHATTPFDLSSLSMSLHKVASSSTMGGNDDEEEVLAFESDKEEAVFYRDKYRVAVDLLNETRAELDEFQVSSRELEAELEKELEATEAKQAELRDRIMRLDNEKDDWKAKFVSLQKMHSSTTANMQREMDNLRSERDKALVGVRDLEMGNDQLERNERVAVSSLLDMEIKYNRAIEEKTLLEQEVIQRNELEEECQRLKDDVRDANNEIAILRDQLARAVVPTPPSSDAPMSPAHDRILHSRSTSRSDSRSDAPSPTPTDRSGATERTDSRGAHATPRNRIPMQSPRRGGVQRSTSTPTGLISPSATKRTTSIGMVNSPSTSGIPSLSRSTTTRNLAGQPLGMSTAANRRPIGATNSFTGRPPSQQSQATKNKGFKLLHDLQARIKTTDDKIGKMVKKAPSGFVRNRPSTGPVPNSASSSASSSSSLSASTMRARTASRSRANTHLAMSSLTSSTATVTPGPKDEKSVGFLSPTSWVLLSEPEDTPPGTLKDSTRAVTPQSPLERSTARIASSTSTARTRTLPSRPSIPSPLVRETKARHGAAETMKLRHGLSASTMVPPSNPRVRGQPLSASVSRAPSRPPSRGHVRAASSVGTRSGATSPSLIPGPRRLSMGIELPSPTPNLGAGRLVSVGGRPPSRTGSAASAASSAGLGPRSHTPSSAHSHRAHTPSGSIGSALTFTTAIQRERERRESEREGAPPPPVATRRPTRRSSMGVDDGMPPSFIPGPRTLGSFGPGSGVGVGMSLANNNIRSTPPVKR